MHAAFGRFLYAILSPLAAVVLKRSRRVRVLCMANGEVLLVKNWFSSQRWTLPGGGIRLNENPRMAATRELWEELRIKTVPDQLVNLGEYMYSSRHVKFAVQCFKHVWQEAVEFRPRKTEIVDARWFSVKELPEDINPIIKPCLQAASKD